MFLLKEQREPVVVPFIGSVSIVQDVERSVDVFFLWAWFPSDKVSNTLGNKDVNNNNCVWSDSLESITGNVGSNLAHFSKQMTLGSKVHIRLHHLAFNHVDVKSDN